MANVRKIEQQIQLCNAAAKVARLSVDLGPQGTSRRQSLAISDQPQYKPRHTTLLEREEEHAGVNFHLGTPPSPSSSHCSTSTTSSSYTELKACTISIDVTDTATGTPDQPAPVSDINNRTTSTDTTDSTRTSGRRRLPVLWARIISAIFRRHGRHNGLPVPNADDIVEDSVPDVKDAVQPWRAYGEHRENTIIAVVSTV